MNQWNLKELRDLIRAEKTDNEAVLAIVHSIDRYIYIFRFHLHGARDALDQVIDPNDQYQKEVMLFVLGASDRQNEYNLAKVASEAHILGAARSARAMFDVFAFLVNSLLLKGSVPERECSIQLVVKKLQPSPLKRELDALLNSRWFGYVSAFDNVAKHRMLVSHSFHVGIEEPYTGIRVGSFEYEGKTYPSYKVREFLEGVLEVKNKIVDCGAILNNQVVRGDA